MKNQVQVFDEREVLGKEFRIYGDAENPLFLAKDVAGWISHNKPNEMSANVDEDEKLKAIVSHSGQNREMWFLTEDGLYEVLMQSRKPIAKKFKKKVKQILKDIRKTGGYVQENQEEKFVENYFPKCDSLVKTFIVEQLKQTKALMLENEAMKPKVDYHDKVLNPSGLVTTSNIAKDLGMSAQRLNKLLNEIGFIYKASGSWKLYSKYQHLVPEYADYHITEYGQALKYTEIGRKYIIELLEDSGII